MGEGRLTWEECWPVIESEARRWEAMGARIGLDRDDLTQEASLTAVECVRRGVGRGYVKTAIRNRFLDVRDAGLARKRVPYEGASPRPGWVQSYDGAVEDIFLPVADASSTLEARQALRILHAKLPTDDWEFLVRALVEGAHLARGLAPGQRRQLRARLRDIQQRARLILSSALFQRGTTMSDAATTEELLPECHANGAEPQGYDRDDTECHNCQDKFTCLPAALDKELIVGSISDDREVEGVNDGTMTRQTALQRMLVRHRLTVSGADIPEDLSVRHVVKPAPVRPAPVAAVPEPEDAPEADPEPEAPAPVKRPVTVAKAAKKTKPRRPNSELVSKEGVPTLRNGKPLPAIRQITEEKMARTMLRIKIGQPFDLDYGMQLVRKTKSGENVIVKLRRTGYELDGVIYPSLSTAIMYKLRKQVSGNDYFSLTKNQCTEIWGADGSVLAGYSTS